MPSKTLKIFIRGDAEEVARARCILEWRLGSDFIPFGGENASSGVLQANFVVSDPEYDAVCREMAEERRAKGEDDDGPLLPARPTRRGRSE